MKTLKRFEIFKCRTKKSLTEKLGIYNDHPGTSVCTMYKDNKEWLLVVNFADWPMDIMTNEEARGNCNNRIGEGVGEWLNFISHSRDTIFEIAKWGKVKRSWCLSEDITQVRWCFHKNKNSIQFMGCYKQLKKFIDINANGEKLATWTWDGKENYSYEPTKQSKINVGNII